MIVSVPSCAFGEEPVTGASSRAMSRVASSAPIARVRRGAIVDMSTHSAPGAAPCATPSSPSSTARTWSPSTTMLITTSLAAPTSAGEPATVPPCSATHASAVARVRLKTVSSWPARARLAAIREPMIPSPTKPTRSVARSVGAAIATMLVGPGTVPGAGAGRRPVRRPDGRSRRRPASRAPAGRRPPARRSPSPRAPRR